MDIEGSDVTQDGAFQLTSPPVLRSLLKQQSPWRTFRAFLSRNRTIVLFSFLAVLAVVIGVTVYFTTIRKVSIFGDWAQ